MGLKFRALAKEDACTVCGFGMIDFEVATDAGVQEVCSVCLRGMIEEETAEADAQKVCEHCRCIKDDCAPSVDPYSPTGEIIDICGECRDKLGRTIGVREDEDIPLL